MHWRLATEAMGWRDVNGVCAQPKAQKFVSGLESLDLEAGPRLTLTVSQTVRLSENTVRGWAGMAFWLAGRVFVDFHLNEDCDEQDT